MVNYTQQDVAGRVLNIDRFILWVTAGTYLAEEQKYEEVLQGWKT